MVSDVRAVIFVAMSCLCLCGVVSRRFLQCY